MKKLITASLFFVWTSTYLKADIITGRCPEKGESLTSDQANARWDWVKRCDPIGYRYNVGGRMATHNGVQRVTYPIYGVYTDSESGAYKLSDWKAPTNVSAPCNIPADHMIVAFCFAGCYTPDQKVSLLSRFDLNSFLDTAEVDGLDTSEYHKDFIEASRSVRSEKAEKSSLYALTLKGNSLKEGEVPTYSTAHKAKLVSSLIDEEHKILVIQTHSGLEVKVTETHPLVDGSGFMRAANTLKVGDELMTATGLKDAITSIHEQSFFGKVWNVDVEPMSKEVAPGTHRIVVAQGLLSGDVSFQNENAKLLNQMVLRQNLPSSLLE